MENQHKKIDGYGDLTQSEIDLMNEVKALGPQISAVIEKVQAHIKEQRNDPSLEARLNIATPERFAALAKTELQTGLMFLTRAVAQPNNF